MVAVKKHFADQFKLRMFGLEYDSAPDFHLCCWQRDKTALPLLCIRTLVFLGCLGTLFTSFIFNVQSPNIGTGYYFIYMTHWGLIINTLNSGFAFGVSCRAYYKGPCRVSSTFTAINRTVYYLFAINLYMTNQQLRSCHLLIHNNHSDFGLPWYLKTYWVFDEMAVTIAFFITAFYWGILAAGDIEFALNPVLDIFIHGINSVLMFILLMTSKHPCRILHLHWPVAFGLIYVLFSVIYYYAGGTDPFGNEFIYPVLDWSKPGQSTILVVICAVIIIIFHAIVVAISQVRDVVTKRIRKDSQTISISNDAYY